MLVVGILIFLAGSFLCGVSARHAAPHPRARRAGTGQRALFTTAFAVVADLFPPAERGKYQGLFGAVFGLTSVVGPLVGGFITDPLAGTGASSSTCPWARWRWRSSSAGCPPSTAAKPRIDILGAIVLAIGVVPLLLALSLGKTTVAVGETGFLWGSKEILGLFTLAVVGIVGFVVVETRVKDPLLDMHLFTNKAFAIGNAAAFVSGAAFLGAIIFLPLFMVNVVGLTATRSGLTTMPLTMGIVFGNIFTGQMVSRVGK